ncbi:hypothetical protein Bca4012_020640 [Brassica carinata]
MVDMQRRCEFRNLMQSGYNDEAQSRGKSSGGGGRGRGYLNGGGCGYGGGCGGRHEGGKYRDGGYGDVKDVSGYSGGGGGYPFLLNHFTCGLRMHIWDYCLKWIILSQFLHDVLVEDKEVMVVVEETVDTETEIVVAMEKKVVDTEVEDVRMETMIVEEKVVMDTMEVEGR